MNHLPYLLSTSVSLAVIKDFSTNYMTALGLNQAYTSLKLCNKCNIVLICSFRLITGNIYYSYKQKVNECFLQFDYTDDFGLILKNYIDTENDFENRNILRNFINILDYFLDLIYSK